MKDVLRTCFDIVATGDIVTLVCADENVAEQLADGLRSLTEESRADTVTELADHVSFLLKASTLPGFEKFFVDYFLSACAKTVPNWIVARNLTSRATTPEGKALYSLAVKALTR